MTRKLHRDYCGGNWDGRRGVGALLLACWNVDLLPLCGMKGVDLLGPTSTRSSSCEGTRFWNELISQKKAAAAARRSGFLKRSHVPRCRLLYL